MQNVVISDDKSRLQIDIIHEFLCHQSYWAKGVPLPVVEKSIQNSLCLGAYINQKQVGFCRLITDFATFANLVDVFVIPAHRGMGISKQLLKAIMEHPELQGLRRMTLATLDAHGLYAQFGFKALKNPETFMECYCSDIYSRSAS